MKNLIFLIALLSLISCNTKESGKNTTKEKNDKTVKIVSTLFPTYDFSKEIGGDKISVRLLLPPGVEAHSYEPTPKDINDINNADIFIYTGDLMEPWVPKLLKSLSNKNLKIVDVSQGIELKQFEFEDEHDSKNVQNTDINKNEEEHIHGKDPHIWTDPVLAKTIVNTITNAIISVDNENKSYYENNNNKYQLKLDFLNTEFSKLSKNSKKKAIISGGHFVFGYLFERYGLEYHSAYEGFSPNAEPTPKQMKALKETIVKTGSKYVYYEELIDPKLAKLLSEELGLKLLLLHGAHNLSRDEIQKGITYYDIMLQNIENLKLGLDYYE